MYSGYRGRSIGRILHYIYEYCGLHYAETVQVGGDKITYEGNLLAEVKWIKQDEVEYPVFKFVGINKETFEATQRAKMESLVDKDLVAEYRSLLLKSIRLHKRVVALYPYLEIDWAGDDCFQRACWDRDVKEFLDKVG